MGFLASFALKFFTGSALSFVSNIVGKLSDAHVAVVQANTGLSAVEAQGVVQSEIVRTGAQRDVQMAQMNHSIWWVAWVLFVIPPGVYTTIIHLKSILCPFIADACTWDIPRVPATIESWDMYVVLSMFGLAATSSVIGLIANRVGKNQAS